MGRIGGRSHGRCCGQHCIGRSSGAVLGRGGYDRNISLKRFVGLLKEVETLVYNKYQTHPYPSSRRLLLYHQGHAAQTYQQGIDKKKVTEHGLVEDSPVPMNPDRHATTQAITPKTIPQDKKLQYWKNQLTARWFLFILLVQTPTRTTERTIFLYFTLYSPTTTRSLSIVLHFSRPWQQLLRKRRWTPPLWMLSFWKDCITFNHNKKPR